MLRRDGTGQADAAVGDGPHRDPSQHLGDGPLYVPSPVRAPAAAAALFRAADPAAHQLTRVDAGSIAGLNSIGSSCPGWNYPSEGCSLACFSSTSLTANTGDLHPLKDDD